MSRLFLSIPIPEDIRQSLLQLQQGIGNAKWDPLSKMHITLRFIGEVKEEDIQPIIQALKALRYGDFKLALSSVGTFPDNLGRPVILWAGMKGGEHLKALNALINTSLKNIPLPAATHAEFIPHMTLAKLENAEKSDLDAYLKAHKNFTSKEFVVDSFSLFRSSEKPGGSYTALQKFSLQPPAQRPTAQRPRL